MNASIRPAAPDDVSEVTRLMYIAGKSQVETSIYDVMWPESMGVRLEKLGRLYNAAARSWYRFDSYLVGEMEGKVAGSLCGYNEREKGGPRLREAFIEIGIDRTEARAISERMQPFYRVYPVHPEDAWVIEHVAVFPEFRGQGLITALLEEILEQGRRSGYKHAELGMLIGNLPAQKAYEKIGFTAADERTDAEFEKIFGAPGMVRMVIKL
jgi:ribosomal protein S18 acetylase RimI-like enzyme